MNTSTFPGQSPHIHQSPDPAPRAHRAAGLISRRLHGMLDYGWALLLIASPWLFGFSHQVIDARIAVIFGAVTALYSMFTSYDLGVIRMVPFSIHIFLDVLGGLALAFAWVHFATWGLPGLVFLVFGVMELAVVLMTRNTRELGTASPGV